jgi:hypothetical protein
MRSTTSASTRDLPGTTSTRNDRIVLAVIPWGYVVRQYVMKQGDRWRPDATRAVSDRA